MENATLIGACPACDAEIRSDHIARSCPRCRVGLPHEIYSRLPQFSAVSSDLYPGQRAGSAAPLAIGREAAIVIGIVGFILLVLGALRWNSMESQFARGFGQSDGLGIMLLLGGAVGLIVGGYALLATPPASISLSVKAISVEERLRQLDDLRSKELITEAQYQQRKQEIVSSL